MVVEKGCIKRISTIRQIINGLNLCNGNNDSCLEQEHYCHYSDRIVFTLPHTHTYIKLQYIIDKNSKISHLMLGVQRIFITFAVQIRWQEMIIADICNVITHT